MKTQHRKALVLNADYTPVGLVSWRRAIVLALMHDETSESGVQVIEYYEDDCIRGGGGKTYRIPAIVRSIQYIKTGKIPFSRKNVFLRDGMSCQYCGGRFDSTELTYDHVIPRAKWKKQNHKKGPTVWENIVTSCVTCNREKANRTPKEAGMSLIKEPAPPNPYGYILGLSPWSRIPQEWVKYLTPLYKGILF